MGGGPFKPANGGPGRKFIQVRRHPCRCGRQSAILGYSHKLSLFGRPCNRKIIAYNGAAIGALIITGLEGVGGDCWAGSPLPADEEKWTARRLRRAFDELSRVAQSSRARPAS